MQHGAFLHRGARSQQACRTTGAPPIMRPCVHIPISRWQALRSPSLLVQVDRGAAVLPGENGKIAFAGARDGNFEIYVVDPDATGGARLTNDPATDTDPAWSPRQADHVHDDAERERRHLPHERRRHGSGAADVEPWPRLELDVVPGRAKHRLREHARRRRRDLRDERGRDGPGAAHEQRRPGRDPGVVSRTARASRSGASATGTARSTSCESTARMPSASRRARART